MKWRTLVTAWCRSHTRVFAVGLPHYCWKPFRFVSVVMSVLDERRAGANACTEMDQIQVSVGSMVAGLCNCCL